MKFKILSEKENPLMKRKEVLIELDYGNGATPSKASLQPVLAKDFSVDVQQLEISKILSESGIPKGKAWIKIWEEKKVPIYAELKKEKKPKEAKPEKKEEPAKEKADKPEETKEEVKKKEVPKEEKKEEAKLEEAKAKEKPKEKKQEVKEPEKLEKKEEKSKEEAKPKQKEKK